MDAARRFYGDLLGLRERAAHRREQILYAVGGQAIVLEPGLAAGAEERLDHVAFETPELESLSRQLTSSGMRVLDPARSCSGRGFRVADPDGHTIEFVQVPWPPPAEGGAGRNALSTRLLHAGVIVRDEARAHTFYRDTLGFIEIWRGGRPPGTTRWVNMRVPDGTAYIEYMLADAEPTRRDRGVLHHLCLRVPDIQEAWEEIARRSTALGTALPAPPQIGVNGRYQLNLFDPDGTRVELMEPFTVR